MDVRARRPSPLHPAGPCSATPPALRLLPCAPLDVGRKDRFPLGTRLREDRARVVNAARARSPFPGTPVAVAWDPRLKTARSTARAPPLLLLPPPLRAPRRTRCRRSRRRHRRPRLAPRRLARASRVATRAPSSISGTHRWSSEPAVEVADGIPGSSRTGYVGASGGGGVFRTTARAARRAAAPGARARLAHVTMEGDRHRRKRERPVRGVRARSGGGGGPGSRGATRMSCASSGG